MPVETINYINDLNPDWPDGTEPKAQGDDHLRNTKKAVKQTFPNVTGAVTPTHAELNYSVGVTSPIQGQIESKASKSGAAYTGGHDFSGASSVELPAATTVGAVTATELGYLSGVSSSIQTQFSGKVSKSGDSYTGAHDFSAASAVNLPANTNIGPVTSAELGRLSEVTSPIQGQFAAVATALNGKVEKSGDTYTGPHDMTGATVSVATPAASDNSSKAASTQFVKQVVADAAFASALPAQAGNAGKYVTTDGVNASWSLVAWSSVNGRPSTLGGYGIVDADTRKAPELKSSAFTAVNGGVYLCDTSTAGFTASLPSSPQPGWVVTFYDYSGSFDTGNVTVGRSGANILGAAEDYTLDQKRLGRTFRYGNSTKGWVVS